jgi:hypothetical protein
MIVKFQDRGRQRNRARSRHSQGGAGDAERAAESSRPAHGRAHKKFNRCRAARPPIPGRCEGLAPSPPCRGDEAARPSFPPRWTGTAGLHERSSPTGRVEPRPALTGKAHCPDRPDRPRPQAQAHGNRTGPEGALRMEEAGLWPGRDAGTTKERTHIMSTRRQKLFLVHRRTRRRCVSELAT